ncbi:MAG TPA: phosphatase PAP2-related protein [Puia sp.]|jgi:membrane-associated phospholipid phosphatase
MPQTTVISFRQEWQEAWHTPGFRLKIMIGLFVVATILCLFPVFFQTIEKRQGVLLNDPLLRILPAHNISVPLFIVIWSITLLSIVRAAYNPQMFLTYLWAFIILSLFRVATITLVPLNAPVGLIGLVDPFSNFFYGDKFVTKDLFFSGHTSAVFLQYLCLPGKGDKKWALLATAIVGSLLLVQHVHYTMDVLGGFVFAWIAWQLARKTILREGT